MNYLIAAELAPRGAGPAAKCDDWAAVSTFANSVGTMRTVDINQKITAKPNACDH